MRKRVKDEELIMGVMVLVMSVKKKKKKLSSLTHTNQALSGSELQKIKLMGTFV